MYSYCEDYKRACDLVKDFCDTVIHKNRYFSKHQFLKELGLIANQAIKTFPTTKVLYRARIFDDYDTLSGLYIVEKDLEMGNETGITILDDYKEALKEFRTRKESGFWGFDAKDSFVPPKSITTEGRNNPAFINYLYTAEEEYTALAEIKPTLESHVSIAKISLLKDLKIADFSREPFDVMSFEDALIEQVSNCLSWIVDDAKKYYIPSQIISEFLKSLGFDGIRYSSSLFEKGHNVTVFNYDKCEPFSSKIYMVRDICINANCTFPYDGTTKIVHPRLDKKATNK